MKKFRIPKYIPALLLTCLLSTACDKDFEEVNANPNAPETVTPDLLLPHGIESAVDLYWGSGVTSLGADVGNLYAQYWARIQYTDVDRYVISQDVVDDSWRDFYIESLADFQRVYELGQESGNANYTAIAMIMRSWVFSLLTDIYGDIPYTEAVQGLDNNLAPAYDAQKDVYAGMIADLKAANDMIQVNGSSVSGDILFNGQMLKWKKFANSLSLRLLNRMLGKADSPIDAAAEMERILSNPTQYPVMSSNADITALQYLAAQPNNNPINQNRISRDDHRVSATLVDKLKSLGDERLAVYADVPQDGGDYKGIPNGLQASDANALGLSKTSKVGAYFTAATAPAVLMSYAELLLIKAEAAYKGVAAAGDPAQNYTDGIKASFQQYGLTADDAYLATTAYKGGTEGYQQIMEQKWIALYGQGLEAWTEQRRTGVPALVAPAASTNGGIIPTRLPYPSSEESLNYVHFREALDQQNGDNDMKLKLWWAK
ncbi:SusD/RagB family nutrient-binding outer membrane lipoprotein [Pontibacter silvestris]|uniref:SusD/RagB family nutrient-binding outer membrane lipoprotein n=1 Tax=Pontibacter silvestris TaxID=2305183 RepID=A0ABW4X2J4_9BACT|nr:SusD/RagB family nutrient-binding outer membrane lipoprotein [Pontibacter silvestris]MCC9135960.1 SusD/RagB family nutrient-binding outer membrane lipoprotein [Pontibacter silvestris]